MAAVCTRSSQVLLAKSHSGAVSTTDTALCGRLLQPQPFVVTSQQHSPSAAALYSAGSQTGAMMRLPPDTQYAGSTYTLQPCMPGMTTAM